MNQLDRSPFIMFGSRWRAVPRHCSMISLWLAPLLCGCPNPNTYTVPRTVPEGELQFMAAPELFAYDYQQGGSPSFGATPHLTAGVRYGVSDRVDVGGRLSGLASPTVDGKIQIVRGVVDVALDPGAQLLYVEVSTLGVTQHTGPSSAAVLELYGPLLVGINLSSSLSLVASPGIGYSFGTQRVGSINGATNAAQAVGLAGRLGLGVDIRATETLAIHPEITLMRVFDAADSVIGMFGVGFNIGMQPDYSDIDGQK
jgi:hypothetical protein